jgi:hypothetical protein
MMSEGEKAIWAAAFVAELHDSRARSMIWTDLSPHAACKAAQAVLAARSAAHQVVAQLGAESDEAKMLREMLK